MHGFARFMTTWLVAAFFAVSSVAWAASGPSLQTNAAVTSADHADHDHSEPVASCLDPAGSSDVADHSHDAESTCCAFACHVVADLACSTALNPAIQAGRHDVTDPAALLGAVPVGPERPPRTA